MVTFIVVSKSVRNWALGHLCNLCAQILQKLLSV